MRTLLAKDLRILRRSPLLLCLLVLYPLVVALLIGLTLSRGSDKPRVAIVNEVPRGESLDVGTGPLRLGISGKQVRDHIEPVRVSTREEAEQLVRDGDVVGALIIPEDTFRQIESRVEQPRLEVIVNEEDPIKARIVDDTIAAALAEANRQVARALTRANLRYLEPAAERRRRDRVREQVQRARPAPDRADRWRPRGGRCHAGLPSAATSTG